MMLTQLLAVMLIVAFNSGSVEASENTAVYVNPSTRTVGLGETFKVNITVSNVENLSFYQVGLTFDPDILEATSFVAGDFFLYAQGEYRNMPPNQPLGGHIEPGVCHAIMWVLKKPGNVSGNGTLATATFRAKAAGNSSINIIKTGAEEAILGCLKDPETTELISFDMIDGTTYVKWLVTVTVQYMDGYPRSGADVYTIYPFTITLGVTDENGRVTKSDLLDQGSYLVRADYGGFQFGYTTPLEVDLNGSGNATITTNYEITPPIIEILYPQNIIYATNSVPLNFTINDYSPISWMGYSLDHQTNVTITGNTTLTGLSEGTHEVIVYANDTYKNMGARAHLFLLNLYPTPVVLDHPSVTQDSVKLTWTESADADFENYKIYQSDTYGSIGNPIHAITEKSTTSYTLSDLSPNTTNYFTIRVFDTDGLYSKSNQVAGTTTSPPSPPESTPYAWIPLATGFTVATAAIIIALLVIRKKIKKLKGNNTTSLNFRIRASLTFNGEKNSYIPSRTSACTRSLARVPLALIGISLLALSSILYTNTLVMPVSADTYFSDNYCWMGGYFNYTLILVNATDGSLLERFSSNTTLEYWEDYENWTFTTNSPYNVICPKDDYFPSYSLTYSADLTEDLGIDTWYQIRLQWRLGEGDGYGKHGDIDTDYHTFVNSTGKYAVTPSGVIEVDSTGNWIGDGTNNGPGSMWAFQPLFINTTMYLGGPPSRHLGAVPLVRVDQNNWMSTRSVYCNVTYPGHPLHGTEVGASGKPWEEPFKSAVLVCAGAEINRPATFKDPWYGNETPMNVSYVYAHKRLVVRSDLLLPGDATVDGYVNVLDLVRISDWWLWDATSKKYGIMISNLEETGNWEKIYRITKEFNSVDFNGDDFITCDLSTFSDHLFESGWSPPQPM